MPRTNFRPRWNGYAFNNGEFVFDDQERADINQILDVAVPNVAGLLLPLYLPVLAAAAPPALGFLDAIASIFGLPPGTVTAAAASKLASGKLREELHGWVNDALP